MSMSGGSVEAPTLDGMPRLIVEKWSTKMWTCWAFGVGLVELEDLKALLASFPGLPSPPCQADFSEEDFRSVDIAWEVWFTLNTIFYVDFTGAVPCPKTLVYALGLQACMDGNRACVKREGVFWIFRGPSLWVHVGENTEDFSFFLWHACDWSFAQRLFSTQHNQVVMKENISGLRIACDCSYQVEYEFQLVKASTYLFLWKHTSSIVL